MTNNEKLNDVQRERVIKELFKQFYLPAGKFEERSEIILSSNDDVLIKKYLEKFFSDVKFWFGDISEKTYKAIKECVDKYRRDTTYDLHKESLFVALNSSQDFREAFDKNNVLSVDMTIRFFEKAIAELNSILKTNKNNVGELFKVVMVKNRFSTALKSASPIVQAGLLNAGLLEKMDIINRCLDYANHCFEQNRMKIMRFKVNSVLEASDCLEMLFKSLIEGGADKQKTLNYTANCNDNDEWLQFVIDSLKRDFRREDVEIFLRKYDKQNHQDYFKFASSFSLSYELETLKNNACKQNRKLEAEDVQYLLPRVRELLKWSDFDAVIFDFAEFDPQNLKLYVESATKAMAYYTPFTIGTKVICDLVKLSSQNGRQDLIDLLRNEYGRCLGLTRGMSVGTFMEIAKNDPKNADKWFEKTEIIDDGALLTAKGAYEFVKTIYNADPQYSEIQFEKFRKLKKSSPYFELFIALMSDDVLMLKEIAEEIHSHEVSADLANMCKDFAKLAEEDVKQSEKVMVAGNDGELLPQTQERLALAREVALDTAYAMFKNRTKTLKTENGKNNDGDIEELLSRLK